MRLAGHGVAVDIHPGWEARVWRADAAPPAVPGTVVRLANFPLPVTKNTYAAEVADNLKPGDVLVSLVELDPSLADRGLYAAQGVPLVRVDDLDPRALQAAGPGRLAIGVRHRGRLQRRRYYGEAVRIQPPRQLTPTIHTTIKEQRPRRRHRLRTIDDRSRIRGPLAHGRLGISHRQRGHRRHERVFVLGEQRNAPVVDVGSHGVDLTSRQPPLAPRRVDRWTPRQPGGALGPDRGVPMGATGAGA